MLRLFPVPIPNLSLGDALDGRLVGQRSDGLGDVLLEGDGVGVAGAEGLALEDDGLAVSLGLSAEAGVLLDAAKEVVARARGANVLDADVQALLEVTVLDLLVDDDTDGGLGDVVDNTGLAMHRLVGHALLDRSVHYHVDNITNVVLAEIS